MSLLMASLRSLFQFEWKERKKERKELSVRLGVDSQIEHGFRSRNPNCVNEPVCIPHDVVGNQSQNPGHVAGSEELVDLLCGREVLFDAGHASFCL